MYDSRGMSWNWSLSRAAGVMVLFALVLLPFVTSISMPSMPRFYFRSQDLPVIVTFAGAMVLLLWRQPSWSLPKKLPAARTVWIAASLLAALLWAGTHLIMFDYPLTRDEHMVAFDAANFAGGRLGTVLPTEWRGYAEALVPNFLITAEGWQVMASAYLPVNAMMRASFGMLLDPALMNPLLVSIGLVVLWSLSRKIFAEETGAVWVAMLTFLLSGQLLTNSMTHYAMTSHVVFNLVWLALFLRGGPVAHALAMVVGFLAIGLHQPIFHPLFAGPILLGLLWQKRLGLFAIYAAVYAAALLLWFSYPVLVVENLGLERSDEGSAAGAVGFITERIVPLLTRIDPAVVQLMLANLLRAIAWNAAYLLPLLLIAAVSWRQIDALGKQLLAGLVLTIVVIAILLPYQGHGWGYRYIHALIGSLCLLAGYGWRLIPQEQKPAAQGGIVALALVSVLALPFQWWSSHRFVEAHLKLYDIAKSQPTDFVLIDSELPSHAVDDVRNLPDLSNRPLLFSSREMNQTMIDELCKRGTLAVLTREDFRSVGLAHNVPVRSSVFEKKAQVLEGKGCVRPVKR
ncbi:MAG: hypothetical protein ACK4QP_10305 [Pseudorhizobium sp.]